MNFENLLTKKKRLDRRRKVTKTFHQWFNRYTRAAAVAGVIAGSLVAFSVYYSTKSISRPLSQTIEVKPIEVEAKQTPFCYDPISCIRDIGEQVGATNQEIMTMIRIGKCESGHRENAVNVNKNGTIDRGVFQLNSIHKDITNKDAFDFEKNIRYAWKMQQKQGFNPWKASIKCWNQK